MTLKQLEKRINAIEIKPWIVVVSMPDGSDWQLSMKRMMQLSDEGKMPDGLCFRTVSGGSLREIDLFLDWIDKMARTEEQTERA